MENPWKRYSKLNPQREEGNRQISNEVFKALMKADLSGAEYKICLAIIEKTWGYNKATDTIACNQFMEMTNLSNRMVKLTIKHLRDRKIIFYKPSNIRMQHGSPLNEFIFNKHYDTWKAEGCNTLHACNIVSRKGATSCQERVQSNSPTKENYTKETITKENILPDVKTFIDFYFEEFKKRFGNPPIIQGAKDGSIIKSLLKSITFKDLQDLLLKMFDSDDLFIQKSGYTLGVFKSQINKLRIGPRMDKKSW